MSELLLELFSEEIPARMQAKAAEDLNRLVTDALAPLSPKAARAYAAPRRIAMTAQIESVVLADHVKERGPRVNAPEAALTGFLRKHNVTKAALQQDGDYWVLEKRTENLPAAALIASVLPGLLRRFPWPKSMRWGHGAFTWVRPLRRILCLLDGAVVPFTLAEGHDDAHGLHSGAETEGHRFHAPGALTVRSVQDWQTQLLASKVVLDAEDRKRLIADGIARLAATRDLRVVEDPGLLDEVAGLVEWPVPLLGRIDAAHMDLPPEVLQVSMRVNQRYFALRHEDGTAAPFFAFAANIEAADGGALIIAGNERVLRARFADARHFWDQDRKTRLQDRVPALNRIIFHAKLASQGERVERICRLSHRLASQLAAPPALAARAALLAKADLTTGMVGEFPELQGIMGGYYARHDGEDGQVVAAIRDHYLPKGPSDPVPTAPVAIVVALADKLDQLVSFFSIGEKPGGSGDPYALRRAALGIVRIIRENGLRIPLRSFCNDDVLDFIADRLRIQLRAEGARHDVLAAVFAAGGDDDLIRMLNRADAVATMLRSDDGANLLAAYKRAANILRIENKKDGPHAGPVAPDLLQSPEEKALFTALLIDESVAAAMAEERFADAMMAMAGLRTPLDAFFERVTVNAPEPELRRNRLAILHQLRHTLDRAADFSKIEG